MNGTAPASNISDVRRTSRCNESEEERQEINESTHCAKEASQLLLEEKQAIAGCEEDLKSEIERGLNALSPIKQLSDDVLCHIFELHCKDSLPVAFPLNHPVWGPRPPPGQYTLSHVCSAWREIILDVPTFWNSIRIVPKDFDTPQTLVSVVKAANTWLSRAKGLPCSIDIDFTEDDGLGSWVSRRSLWKTDWHDNIIRDIISLHKFKKLSVTFADHHLRDLLQLPDDKLSCVEDLCLRYISLDEDDAAPPLDLHKLSNLTSFSFLPNLFDPYSLCNPSKDYSKLTGIPWHNLRHIRLRATEPATMPASFCLDVLTRCSAVLETCSLVITTDQSSPRVPAHLSQLRELKVIVCSLVREKEILESFLLSLRFPRLSSLTLGSLDDPPVSIDFQKLLRVQDASQMHLEELIIPDLTLDVDVRTLLTAFPSLRRVELPETVTFTDEAMIEVGAGSIGVFLEDLTIYNSDLDLEKLLQMVKARSRAGDRDGKCGIEVTEFKSVTLHCDGAEYEVGDEVLNSIEEIKLSGVDLNMVFAQYSDEESQPSFIW
ncbi:hypothetical protein JOM56_004715 [Amanita muscaria]